MNQLELAIHSTAMEARGGLKALAHDIGIGEQVLRNKVNPYQDTHKLSLLEAQAMMRRTGDLRILEAQAAEFGRRISGPISSIPASLMQAMLDAAAEDGDVMRAVADGMADGRWTQAEVAESIKQIREAISAKERLLQTLLTVSGK